MKYSVIIPAYNAEKTLRRCLASIPARPDTEVILVSDGSTDATEEIAAEFPVRLVRMEHRGVSAARNRGLSLARGRYVTFVDSDDFVTPDYFSVMDASPDRDVQVYGVPPGSGDPMLRLFATRTLDSVCNKRFRRDFLEENQARFDESFAVGEDFLYCFRLLCRAEQVGLSEKCIYHADLGNENSLSRGYRPYLAENMAKVYRKAAQCGKYLGQLDFWYIRYCLSALAELWKAGWPTLGEIHRVCDCFREPIGPAEGFLHSLLRWAVEGKWDLSLAAAAFLGKGRKFWRGRKS